MSLLSQITIFCILWITASLSTLSYLGGTPIVSILLMLNITSPAILFFLIPLQSTIPIVNMVLLATSLVVAGKDIKKISKYTKKYAMDYELIVMTVPLAASGALFGVLVKNLISDQILSIFSGILMIYLMWKGFVQFDFYFEFRPNNTNQKSQSALQNSNLKQKLIPLQDVHSGGITNINESVQPIYRNYYAEPEYFTPLQNSSKIGDQTRQYQQVNPELQKILSQQQTRFSKPKFKIIGFVLLYTIAIALTKKASTNELIVINPSIDIPSDFKIDNQTVTNTKIKKQNINFMNYFQMNQKQIDNFQQITGIKVRDTEVYDPKTDVYVDTEQISSCVVGSFIFIIIHVTLSYLSSKSVAMQITTKDSEKQKYGYVFSKEIDKMSSKKMWNIMIAGFFSGMCVSLLGVGGSIVLVPVWLQIGIDIETALISSMPVTFFAAFVSTLLLTISALSGQALIGLVAILIFMVVTILLTLLTDWILQKYLADRNPILFRNKVRRILYLSSLIALVLYCLPAYVFNQNFSKFGSFC